MVFYFDLDTPKCTALLLVNIYQLAKYEKDPIKMAEKSFKAGGGKEEEQDEK